MFTLGLLTQKLFVDLIGGPMGMPAQIAGMGGLANTQQLMSLMKPHGMNHNLGMPQDPTPPIALPPGDIPRPMQMNNTMNLNIRNPVQPSQPQPPPGITFNAIAETTKSPVWTVLQDETLLNMTSVMVSVPTRI